MHQDLIIQSRFQRNLTEESVLGVYLQTLRLKHKIKIVAWHLVFINYCKDFKWRPKINHLFLLRIAKWAAAALRPMRVDSPKELTSICFVDLLELESSRSCTVVLIGVPFLQTNKSWDADLVHVHHHVKHNKLIRKGTLYTNPHSTSNLRSASLQTRRKETETKRKEKKRSYIKFMMDWQGKNAKEWKGIKCSLKSDMQSFLNELRVY